MGEGTLQADLAQAKRDEEWALLVLLAWIGLLACIVVVLVLSPVPWGALVGLAVWAMGAKGVYTSFSEAAAHTQELESQLTDRA